MPEDSRRDAHAVAVCYCESNNHGKSGAQHDTNCQRRVRIAVTVLELTCGVVVQPVRPAAAPVTAAAPAAR